MAKKKKKNMWFTSTLQVLILIFVMFTGVGIYRYGWETVLDQSIFYIIGCSFTAIVAYIISMIYRNKGIKLQ